MNTSSLAPICIFVYNRPQHTEKMLNSLIKNPLFEESEVFVFADGPKVNSTESNVQNIKNTRDILKLLTGHKKLIFNISDTNIGLVNSMIPAITKLINKYGKIIVVEDDVEVSSGFLKYMNDALNLYKDEERVMHIGGYMVPHKKKLPETFFLKSPTIWGWGTWKRAWDKFESDATILLRYLEQNSGKDFAFELDVKGTYNYTKQLKDISAGTHKEVWDIQWATSIYLHGGLCLHPKSSLTRNNGFDGSGIHCYPSKVYEKQKTNNDIKTKKEELVISNLGQTALMDFHIAKNKLTLNEQINSIYYKLTAALPAKMKNTIKGIIKKLFKISK